MRKLTHTIFFYFFLFTVFAQVQTTREIQLVVDSVVHAAIREEAFPGCVIHVSKGEEVLLHQAYGFHTYDSIREVKQSDIYDLASITKVVAATVALMKLYEEGYFQLDDPIGNYIPKLGRKVGRVTFREALAHQGGLYPWIPFHSEVKRPNGKFKCKTVAMEKSEEYPFPLSDSLFLHKDFYLKIKKMIRRSGVSDDKNYKYSGLFFYLVPELVLHLSGSNFTDFLNEKIYQPLKLETLSFNPLDNFPQEMIVPTEVDTFFRQELIHGKVHDEGAIMMKGVSGNAGLFSNSADLTKLFRLFLEEGQYDTLSLIKPSTIDLFTTAQYPGSGNRRGLGFDKPLLEYDSVVSSVAQDASFRSFGHTGFTGSIAWADPENDLIFIFLTNRVYPNRLQKAIYNLNIRPTLHQLFYDQISGEILEKDNPVEASK